MNVITRFFMFFIIVTLAACGGGGGGGGDTPATTTKTTAVLKIGSTGVPNDTIIGVGLEITLPLGVTVATDTNGAVPLSVANVSGTLQGWGLLATYKPAANAMSNATLTLVASPNAGPFVKESELFTVTCSLPVDNTLTEANFSKAIITSFKPVNSAGITVGGLQPTLIPTLN